MALGENILYKTAKNLMMKKEWKIALKMKIALTV